MSLSSSKVSVVIPTYNRGELIRDTLESVAYQTFLDWECFVVDDGSTDNTGAFVRAFVENDGRFHYVWQKNAERCEARNHGLRLAQGEYVAFLDHDDLWEPDFLKDLVALLDRHPSAGVAFANGYNHDGERHVVLPEPGKDIYRQIINGWNFPPVNALVRKGAAERIKGFRNACLPAEDHDFWLRLGAVYPMVATEKMLAYYRNHAGNTTNTIDRRLILKAVHRAHADLLKSGTLKQQYRRDVNIRRIRCLLNYNFAAWPEAGFTRALGWVMCSLCASPTAVWRERWVFRALIRRMGIGRPPIRAIER